MKLPVTSIFLVSESSSDEPQGGGMYPSSLLLGMMTSLAVLGCKVYFAVIYISTNFIFGKIIVICDIMKVK